MDPNASLESSVPIWSMRLGIALNPVMGRVHLLVGISVLASDAGRVDILEMGFM